MYMGQGVDLDQTCETSVVVRAVEQSDYKMEQDVGSPHAAEAVKISSFHPDRVNKPPVPIALL